MAEEDKVVLSKLVTGAKTRSFADSVDSGTDIRNSHASYFNQTITQLRNLGKQLEAIRTLARVHGDVSAAVSAMVRLAMTNPRYRVYDSSHQLSYEGSQVLRTILLRLNTAFDYTKGYDDRQPLTGVFESLFRSLPLTGAAALELVLDENRLPYKLMPVSVETLKFQAKGRKVIPVQTASGAGKDISLDIPTFFYAAMDYDPNSAYPFSPIEPALNMAVFHSETVESIRRVVNRSGHSRLSVTLKLAELLASAPASVRSDPAKLATWVEAQRTTVKEQIEALGPEHALVMFDTMTADYLNSQIGNTSDYSPFMETLDGLLATTLKTPAAVVGKRTSAGSQNTSSTESLLFIKTAEGLHKPVASLLSRALTLAVRLYGGDFYVQCDFEPIDLRPEIELEAFKAMRQARILEQWSLGCLTDEEAAEELGTGPRAPGAPKLSGTGIYKPLANEAPSPNGDPARRAMTTDAPKSSGGRDNATGRS